MAIPVAAPPAPTSTPVGPCFPPEHLYYLASGFPATSLTINDLRRILLAHDVKLPIGRKESYVQAFNDFVFGDRGGILRAHAEKRRPRRVKTQDIPSRERDNHLTAAFLGAEWFYLTPGFDVRILNQLEVQRIIERHGLDRGRGARKKGELVTLFEESVVAIRDTVVRKQAQTAGSSRRSHVVNGIVNDDDSDEGERPKLADRHSSLNVLDQHSVRSGAAAVDNAEADDDIDKGGKEDPELDAANSGVRSPAPWAIPRTVPQTTTTFSTLQPKGQAEINVEFMAMGMARRPNVSQRGQTSTAESTNNTGLPQKQADGKALTAPLTKSATNYKSTHKSGPSNATHAFTRSTRDGDYSNASLPTTSLAATHPLPFHHVKQLEDLTHRIRTLEVALEEQLGALLQRVNGIEQQVGHLAPQINILGNTTYTHQTATHLELPGLLD